jgi:anaerobic selenocysteine-containing dehydrogenase
MTTHHESRRKFLKISGSAIILAPVLVASGNALAAPNAALRTSLKYQPKPLDGKQCSGCAQFVPGAKPDANGTCKIIPNDNEIAPTGYCVGWAKKP